MKTLTTMLVTVACSVTHGDMMDMKNEHSTLSSRLWTFRRYRLWLWIAIPFAIAAGILAVIVNVVALIVTDVDFIGNVEEIENGKNKETDSS